MYNETKQSIKFSALAITIVWLTACNENSSTDQTAPSKLCTSTQYFNSASKTCNAKASQRITGLSLASLVVSDKAVLGATASSGFAVAYSSKTPVICTVNGAEVTALAVGVCTIAANQAGNSQILAAPEVTARTTVGAKNTLSPFALTVTGVTACANEASNNLLCTTETLGVLSGLGQDGEVQAGSKMSYTVLTQNGADCVKDNVTGLIWEQKTDDGGLRDKDWGYTWYNSNSSISGGLAGYQDFREFYPTEATSSCGDSLSKCNTQAYVAALNAATYCGYNDWRMPSRIELTGLVDFSKRLPNTTIHPIFANTPDTYYWSSSQFARYDSLAWRVDFSLGITNADEKSYKYAVRAVRFGQ